MDTHSDRLEIVVELQSSLLTFIRFFFKILNGREFKVSHPVGRESHILIVIRDLERCAWHPNIRQVINLPPGYGKSTLLAYWVAWTLSRWPYSQYLYISYSKHLASQHTETVRRIIQLREYKELFGVEIRHDARGKELFKTNYGGAVAAMGSGGTITGFNAGLPDMDVFSGAMIMDDMHKPDEVHSDITREKVIQNFKETLSQRPRGINVPQILIAQRLHERDICSFLLSGGDGYKWNSTILKALDDAGNALYPEKDPKESLLIKQKVDIYTFASQYQQNPQPAGGALYNKKMFPVLENEPDFLCTYITADTAETDKSYNDATVFSFWGLYKIENTELYGLHWIDCWEIRVEPKDLRDQFMAFWHRCQCHEKPPFMAAIEKKSTGTTLLSVLNEIRGIQIRDIDRNVSSGNKTQRFLWLQPYIAQKLVSFTYGANHIADCIKQAESITANDTHAHDDIIDTLYDAVKIGLIDKTLTRQFDNKKQSGVLSAFSQDMKAKSFAKQRAYGHGQYR